MNDATRKALELAQKVINGLEPENPYSLESKAIAAIDAALAPAAPVAGPASEQERIALQAGVEAYVATAGGTMLDRMDAAVRAVLALRPSPAALVAKGERESLRDAQREAVMPLIGPLLDAWEGSSQQCREELPELDKWLRRLNRAMEDAPAPAAPVAQPLTDAEAKLLLKKSDLLDMFLHIGWYSAPRKGFDEHGMALIRAIERAHGIGQGGA